MSEALKATVQAVDAAVKIANMWPSLDVAISGRNVTVVGLGRTHRFSFQNRLDSPADRDWALRYCTAVFILDETCNNLGLGRRP